MEAVLLFGFAASLYALIGRLSTNPFRSWCGVLFNGNKEVAKAAGTIAAVFWPIGWPAIVLVGVYYTLVMVYEEARNVFLLVVNSFEVVAKHYKESERGEQ